MPDDQRVVDLTGAGRTARQIPKSMLVIGGGIIGLEMATVYEILGLLIDVVDAGWPHDRRRSRSCQSVGEKNAGRFNKVMLKTKTVSARLYRLASGSVSR